MVTKYNKAQVRSHIELGICIRCGLTAGVFDKAHNKKSYLNTGLCQLCQDQLPKGEINGRRNNREVKTIGKDN